MGCRTLYLNGVAIGVACDRTRRYQKCSSCSAYRASVQCDYPVRRVSGVTPDVEVKSGTCDRWLCRACAVSIGPDKDYCPPHHRMSQTAAKESA